MSGSESGSGESQTDDGVEERCPPDCDPVMFAKVLDLRERKLDQEDILQEIQKAIEALKKENDALIKKEKIIDMGLRNTEAEIQDFQTQKQQKLNELDVVVCTQESVDIRSKKIRFSFPPFPKPIQIPLHLHQLQYLDKSALPADLSPALVFVNSGLVKLRERIRELQEEKMDIRKQHKELRRMHVSLVRSRKEKQLKVRLSS